MFKSVMVPVDVSMPDETQKLLAAAGRLTTGWDCALHVVCVVPDAGMAIVGAQFPPGYEGEMRARVEAELQGAVAASGLAAQTHVMTGTIYDRVITLADQLDIGLIVIGAHRPELKDYLLGSNAARLVRHSRASVLVLRD